MSATKQTEYFEWILERTGIPGYDLLKRSGKPFRNIDAVISTLYNIVIADWGQTQALQVPSLLILISHY
jgi:hypothetical protein